MESRDIYWIGWKPQVNALATELYLDLGRRVVRCEDAFTGLEAVRKTKYPLILLDDVIPAGKLTLPNGLDVDDTVGIGCLVIREIRKTQDKERTPIIVTYPGVFIGHDVRSAKDLYRQAGTNDFFDWSKVVPRSFSRLVDRYLQNRRVASK